MTPSPSTYCAQLLPLKFREYYLDHVNLSNKFDKEMALTSNLFVNLDELDQIKSGKQAELKQMLSKIQVNGRPIFGKAQRSRKRYASFVATTNNPRPEAEEVVIPLQTRDIVYILCKNFQKSDLLRVWQSRLDVCSQH